jgi:hypothetical protein
MLRHPYSHERRAVFQKIFSKLFSPNILNSQQPIFVLKG